MSQFLLTVALVCFIVSAVLSLTPPAVRYALTFLAVGLAFGVGEVLHQMSG